ncbi:MAG TPA: NAD-binding protein, partial [Kofleriaceae bacterium]|nr:NAD-binding protein [Kofleriaceae bacterium]
RLSASPASILAVSLSQGGELAFVVFSIATANGAMDSALADLLTVVVTLSMATTPLVFALNERAIQPWLKTRAADTPKQAVPDEDSPVLIAGFGRFGQIVARILAVRKIAFTALDKDPAHIQFVARFGNKVYFGDCSRLDLLRTAGAAKAKVLVLAIDDVEASIHTAEIVKQHFPDLRVFARARNRPHAYRLMNLGVEVVNRETFAASLEVARDVLIALGLPDAVAGDSIRLFRDHDESLMTDQASHQGDLDQLIKIAEAGRQQLEALFDSDRD